MSGWKGFVTHGLGADISLPPCLATGIWKLAPKASSGPKSRGASFGATLWHHVQGYCFLGIYFAHAHFPYKWNSYLIGGKNICIVSTKSNPDAVKKYHLWVRVSLASGKTFSLQAVEILFEMSCFLSFFKATTIHWGLCCRNSLLIVVILIPILRVMINSQRLGIGNITVRCFSKR